ncbi:hypothetical protein DFH09DRAFT_1474598 [Mycena vulgaris]|nr:hypothetical protein DFH09DRAFT_1474598 [Mycena vulgaris]
MIRRGTCNTVPEKCGEDLVEAVAVPATGHIILRGNASWEGPLEFGNGPFHVIPACNDAAAPTRVENAYDGRVFSSGKRISVARLQKISAGKIKARKSQEKGRTALNKHMRLLVHTEGARTIHRAATESLQLVECARFRGGGNGQIGLTDSFNSARGVEPRPAAPTDETYYGPKRCAVYYTRSIAWMRPSVGSSESNLYWLLNRSDSHRVRRPETRDAIQYEGHVWEVDPRLEGESPTPSTPFEDVRPSLAEFAAQNPSAIIGGYPGGSMGRWIRITNGEAPRASNTAKPSWTQILAHCSSFQAFKRAQNRDDEIQRDDRAEERKSQRAACASRRHRRRVATSYDGLRGRKSPLMDDD